MKINPIGHLVKTNPIQTQSNPIAERVKLMQSVFLQRIMKKNVDRAMKKQSQNKPNSNPIKACPERSEFTLSVIEGNGPISNANPPCTNNAICYT
jgi:hypothetical protein